MLIKMNPPSRCVDPIIKNCANCRYGHVEYPEWIETHEDLAGCCYDTSCLLGYDKGRLEDEPTEDEMEKFDEWCKKMGI